MNDDNRELVAPNGDKRLVRRDSKGRFAESDDLGKSLAQDVRRRAMRKVPKRRDGAGTRI